VFVGEFPRTLGGRSKSQGFENPFKNNPTPCTNQQTNQPQQYITYNLQEKRKKMKKLKRFDYGKKKKGKMHYRLMDGRRWMGWSERGRRWCCGGGGRGWWRWVGVVWMFREVMGGNGVSGCGEAVLGVMGK
jgi:hypothetical protein